MYLITAKYSSDSERKRIEYVIDRWRDRKKITKPDGVVAIVADDDIKELLVELYSRTERENVSFYRIEEETLEVSETKREIRLKISERRETAEKLLDFIMARQRATLKMESSEIHQKVYEVISRKGKVEIILNIRGNANETDVIIRLSGYGEAVDFIHDKLSDELKLLEG